MTTISPQEGHELRKYLDIMMRWSWFLGLCTVVAALAGLITSKLQQPMYRAAAILIVDQRISGQGTYSDVLSNSQLATTYASLIDQPAVLQLAASQVDGASAGTLAARTHVSAPSGSEIIQVEVDDPSPRRAAALANAVVAAFGVRLEEQQVASSATVRVFQPAVPPAAPDHPKPLVYSVIGGTLGLVLAASVVLLIEVPDRRIRTAEDLEGLTGLSVLGQVGAFHERDGSAPSESRTSRSTYMSPWSTNSNRYLAESLRVLCTNLCHVSPDGPAPTLLVTSATPGDGKTTIAINLAIVLAQAGRRVLLIDANLRMPSVHSKLDLPNRYGLSNWLAGQHLDADEGVPVFTLPGMPYLSILTAGPSARNPTKLLSSDRMRRLIEEVHGDGHSPGQVDMVIIDSPAIRDAADPLLLAAHASRTLLVVDAARARVSHVRNAQAALGRLHVRLAGAVLNRVRLKHLNGNAHPHRVRPKHLNGNAHPLGPRIEAGATGDPRVSESRTMSTVTQAGDDDVAFRTARSGLAPEQTAGRPANEPPEEFTPARQR